MAMAGDPLYIFCDESGNFDFSPTGTRYFIYTALTTTNPASLCDKFNSLRHQLMAEGTGIERFHAAEDRQVVRDRVLDILQADDSYRLDSLIVRKTRCAEMYRPTKAFYPFVFYYLLRYIVRAYRQSPISRMVIVTDPVEVKSLRKAIEKGVKENLERIFREEKCQIPYLLLHHESKSNGCLQAADYCNWAIYVKWSRDELRPYGKVAAKIKSEFDIFRSGTTEYY